MRELSLDCIGTPAHLIAAKDNMLALKALSGEKNVVLYTRNRKDAWGVPIPATGYRYCSSKYASPSLKKKSYFLFNPRNTGSMFTASPSA